ncbi:hypothetical protein LTR72_011096 [Exophiala xenobiotica]|nr:hypothetical protein LTR72_011096 [Exophiala xenobiotica]KAK5284750.1 hypothetical protein LTR14_011524 [Exophiala xenobiotica]KAK5311682.1 hypothetical protein LTR93_011632 [Exophiala xenobiotica]KAK5468995.1 hypothetical protein LTR55_011469 [Exophiala xenobiotica]
MTTSMTRSSENLSQLCGQRRDPDRRITLEGGTFKDKSAGNQHLSRIWKHVREAEGIDDIINPFTQHGVRHDYKDTIEVNEILYEEVRESLRREAEPRAKQVKKLRNPSKVEDSCPPPYFQAKFDRPPPRYSRYTKPEFIVQTQS